MRQIASSFPLAVVGIIILSAFYLAGSLFSLEKLKNNYLITYGDPTAPVRVVNYFSFNCQHCIALFQKDFKEIKERYLDTGQIYWVFHPVPMDLLTVQGMECLEKMTPKQKQIFLEAILEESNVHDPLLGACMMQKAMELFEKPIPKLQDKSYISSTDAFQDSFKFLSQTEKMTAVPTVEINGQLFIKEVPELKFIESQLVKLRGAK